MVLAPPADDKADSDSPFDVVCEKLKLIGALSVVDFLNGPRSVDDYWGQTQGDTTGTANEPGTPTFIDEGEAGNREPSAPNPILRLYETAQRVFGSSDPLTFEFIEDGPVCKQCILTIQRPGGLSRTYRTEPTFSSKNDAKTEAARIATEEGAVDFIISGESDIVKAKKGLLAPLDPNATSKKEDVVKVSTEDDLGTLEVEHCCRTWRGDQVKPHWVTYRDFKDNRKFGVALRIQLTPHLFQTYSCPPVYDTPEKAKNACARKAISEDVLNYIKHGNGQMQPPDLHADGEEIEEKQSPVRRNKLSLQSYYETLPRPFPEPFGDKTAHEVNAPTWLNDLIQSARGGGMRTSFYSLHDSAHGLHGCLLRLDTLRECKTYLVDPCLGKRGDTKSAVCLFAASQGVGEFVRSVALRAEKRLTDEMRSIGTKVQGIIYAECARMHSGFRLHVNFEPTFSRDAHGCVVKLDLIPTSNFSGFGGTTHYEYRAPNFYRNKLDAKLGACYVAAQRGAVELMRFRGRRPPPTYVPFLPTTRHAISESAKRKIPGMLRSNEYDSSPMKRRRLDSGGGIAVDMTRNNAANNEEMASRLRARALSTLPAKAVRDVIKAEKPPSVDSNSQSPEIPYQNEGTSQPRTHRLSSSPGPSTVLPKSEPPRGSANSRPQIPLPPKPRQPPPEIVPSELPAKPFRPHNNPPQNRSSRSISSAPSPRRQTFHTNPQPQLNHGYPTIGPTAPPAFMHQVQMPPPPPPGYPPTGYFGQQQPFIMNPPTMIPPGHSFPPPFTVFPGPFPPANPYGQPFPVPPPNPAMLPPPAFPAPPDMNQVRPPPAPALYNGASFVQPMRGPESSSRKQRTPPREIPRRFDRDDSASGKWDHDGFEANVKGKESFTRSNQRNSMETKEDDVDAHIKRATQVDDVKALAEHCRNNKLIEPKYDWQPVNNGGNEGFQIWLILGSEKIELKALEADLERGKQKLASKVLTRLKKKDEPQGPRVYPHSHSNPRAGPSRS